jgi:nitrite reductase/ring-hydroxylating ferredoxin subunit
MTQPANPPPPKAAFPIRQSDEHRLSRRQFTCCIGLAAVAGLGLSRLQPWSAALSVPVTQPVALAGIDDLPVGGHKLFRFPDTGHPGILIRLEEERFVAYDQRCTHLMCPVHFNADTRQLICPCHKGSLSADDGSVLAGPPPRPLPQYPVAVHEDRIWLMPESRSQPSSQSSIEFT